MNSPMANGSANQCGESWAFSSLRRYPAIGSHEFLIRKKRMGNLFMKYLGGVAPWSDLRVDPFIKVHDLSAHFSKAPSQGIQDKTHG